MSDEIVREPARDTDADGLDCFAREGPAPSEGTAFAREGVRAADRTGGAGVPDATPAVPVRGPAVPIHTPDVLSRTTKPPGPARVRTLDVWREKASGQLGRECIVVASIIVVLTVQIITRQADESANDRLAVASPSEPFVPAPTIVAAVSQPAARLVPEVPPARRFASGSTRLETMTAKPRAVSTVATTPRPSPRDTRVSAPAVSAKPARPLVSSPAATPIESRPAAVPQVMLAKLVPGVARGDAVHASFVPSSDRSSIERVLEAYRDAYDQLDASSAAAVWPGADTRALNRAFRMLAEQDVSFDSCQLDIGGSRANARCVGEIRYVGRVGDQVPQVRRASWSFALERVSDRWQIARVTAN